MTSLPSNVYLRNLKLSDLDQVDLLEGQAFSENERASRAKIAYRLTHCASICFGLFEKTDNDNNNERLIGHTLSTQTDTLFITDEAMEIPTLDPRTQMPLSGQERVGHLAQGRTVALHSLAVADDFRKRGYAQVLMRYTAERLKKDNNHKKDRIAIIVHEELVPFYERLGYKDNGPSKCAHGGEKWNDMWLDL